MAVIGIDIGTTSICALRMEQGQVQEVKKQSHGFLDTRLYTQDPEEILATVRRLTESLWSSQVTDIAISAQMHGILFTDARGRAVSPFYTWKNPWGHQAMEGRTVAQYLARETRGRVLSGYGLCTAFCLCRRGEIPGEAVSLCNIGDYVAMGLTGARRPVMNVTMAESLGGFSRQEGDFQRPVLEALGLREALFPQVQLRDHICGSYRGARVHAALGDNQCSFLGSVSDYRRDVCINVGTGQQVSCYSPQYIEAADTEVRSFFHLGWLYVGVSQNGGKVYERLIRMIESLVSLYTGEQVDGYAKTQQLWQQREAMAGIPRVTPALYGPIGSCPAGSVLLEGLEEGQDALDLITGYVDGMARELVRLYRQIPAAVREGKTRFVAAGNGIVRNPILWALTEEKLQKRIERECRDEAAAAGAALYVTEET